MKLPESQFLIEYHQREIMRHLTENVWVDTFFSYRTDDTRSWWRKLYDQAHWNTIGRFRAWLHRDCGDY